MPLTGRCQCGAVAYAADAAPLRIYLCHCVECRRQSASAFGISVIVTAASLRLLHGATRCWTRPTATGRTLDCHFCPDCGTRLWHATRGDSLLSLKGGTLDPPPDLRGAAHIWTSHALPGIPIPADAETWPEEPPP